MATMDDYIKKMIDGAKRHGGRVDLQKGNYVFSVLGLTHEVRERREKLGKAMWIDVVVSESEAVDGSTPNLIGTRLDFPLALAGQYADMAFADLKTFLAELTGCEDDQVSGKYSEFVDVVSDEGKHSNPAQPARGMKIGAYTREATIKSGKNEGKTKFYPLWTNIPQTPEEIRSNRQKLDADKL